MPVYDYLCSACDHRADILHGINDPGPNFCPSCGAEGTMRKQFAAPAVHFKGTGWAKKDRSTPSKSSTKSEGTSADGASKEGSANGATGAGTEKASQGGSEAAPSERAKKDTSSSPASSTSTD